VAPDAACSLSLTHGFAMTRRPTSRLRCERLEDRTTPSLIRSITVTTAADVVDPNDGLTSLREAIAESQAPLPPGDIAARIEFAPELAGATIELSQIGSTAAGPAAFEVHQSVWIEGSGQKITRAAGAPHFRFFSVFDDYSLPVPTTRFVLQMLELVGGYSDGVGGAIYSRGAQVGLNMSVLAGNSAAGFGGAIYADGGWVMTGGTLTGNTARPTADGISRGGAIYMTSDPVRTGASDNSQVGLGFATLVGNVAGEGAQVYADLNGLMSRVSVEWSILYTSQPAGGNVEDLVVVVPANLPSFPNKLGTRNLIGLVSGSEWDVVSSADPLLGLLQDNGGPTRTMLPQPGSPAINAGILLTGNLTGFEYDQRGYSRLVGTALDLGAVEVGAVSLPSPQVIPPPPPPTDPLPPGFIFVPASPPIPDGDRAQPTFETATGAAPGQLPEVRLYDANKKEVKRFLAYDASFLGGVNVAIGYVNGDAIPDIITAAGAGGGPHVKVFDGRTFEEIASFYAYDPSFAGGVNVAVGDVNGDGRPEIVTGAGPGGGPHVKVFDGQTFKEIAGFYAYDPSFTGGVSVAVKATVLNDTTLSGQIVTGAGVGGGPHVKVFDATTLAEVWSFYAYAPDFAGGVNVAADNYGRIITGAGPGGGPHLKVFDTTNSVLTEVLSMYTTAVSASGGVRVGVSNPDWVMAVTRRADGETESERFDFQFIQSGYGPIPPALLPKDDTFPSDLGAIASISGPTFQPIRYWLPVAY